MHKRKVIGYFLYGSDRKYRIELFFSIFSALKQIDGKTDEVTIALVTDQTDFDPDLPIEILPISSAELAHWKRNGTYNHRAKSFAVLKLLDHYQCPIAMVDTDTFFTQNPALLFDRIAPGRTTMYQQEVSALAEKHDCQQFIAALGDGIEAEGVKICRDTPMYNSGVIGIDPSDRHWMEKSIPLIDAIYAVHPVFTAEQIAVGTLFEQNTKLTTSDDLIFHYCDFSRYFIHPQIAKLIPDFSPATMTTLLQNPFPDLVRMPPMSYRDRLLTRIIGTMRQWQDTYRYAYLTYRSALSYVSKNRGFADAWARITLQMLKMAELENFSLASARQDFRRLQPNQLNQAVWLDPATKAAWQDFWKKIS